MSAPTADDEHGGFLTARTLSEALPYIQRYDRETVVIKYGGHAMTKPELSKLFANDVVLLKHLGANPVVIHGGGPQIEKMLERLGIKSSSIDGLRITDEATMEVVEMVLIGGINGSIVRAINAAGGKAIGLAGADGKLLTVKKAIKTRKNAAGEMEDVDLGFVGDPDKVDPSLLLALASSDEDFIPVVAPVAASESGDSYNVNADTAAGAIAGSLKAKRLLLLTDIEGVLDSNGQLIRQMTRQEAKALIAEGAATGGMIPKLETAVDALDGGVEAVVILDGRKPHALLVELFTEHGSGTLIR
ncbi:MAG: acetylglutamate kinase [Caulobacterales bacterium]